MKPERAQELYSDYAEGALTPALRQALEQHFEADPSARADYDQFAQIYALLEQPLGQEMEAPLGFRAKILERAAEQQARRETTISHRAAGLFGGWFAPPAHRRATGGALAALAVVVIGGILVTHPALPGTDNGGFGTVSTASISGIVQSVDMKSGTNYFHLHLPTGVTSATVNAYVVTASEQITDRSHLSEAIPAVTDHHLTDSQGLQIPISPAAAPPAGSTLTLLAEYKPDSDSEQAGAEAVFTPFGAADPATLAPANVNFLDGMQAIAAHYGATVIVDVTATPTQPVTADFSSADPLVPLKAMASGAGYTVQKSGSTYYVTPAP